ncbi:type II toxin-antitoxin system Phd/YefM family antitoxin [Ectothiorhodospiraceae bacterium WFHF3C12]|nr:type II toxin-antitoxin system Phd/YefM family antitoxin [Ectothiorhodospiraceae bacterium WFHF3C12]
MTSKLYAETTGSITELKRNPKGVLASGQGAPVAILSHNQPAFYCIPADTYEAMMERMEDLELAAKVHEREHEKEIKVDWDDL